MINCPMCGSEEGIKDSKDYRPKNYYVSLVRGLLGYYLKFNACSAEIVREHLLEYYGKLWCSIYTEQEFKSSRYYATAKVINEDAPIKLYNHYEWD